ncbi:MAG: DUF2284 domain-containing protein [Candidatus Omnitrophica bacterium]|nr:DUF2284 domain-containing protein [Candidatus Omnitrophota bacterium]
MIKYCKCNKCIKNKTITNPYNIYQKAFSLEDIHIDFDYRVTALCKFGCEKFSKKPTCPPNIPEIEFFRDALGGYKKIYIIGRKYPYSDGLFSDHWRIYSTNEIHDLLLKKETEFFNEGYLYAKAFIGGSCKICSFDNCNSTKCAVPGKGRISLEGTGIQVFSLMKLLKLEYEEPPVNYFWRIGMVFF